MIRLINEDDLSQLRQWKNDHREVFFYKGEISEEQQIKWFREYQERPDDYMFMVLSENIPIGCMAIRLIDKEWDTYNIILGLRLPEYLGKGLMSEGLREMLRIAVSIYPIPVTAKILRDNPAIEWYKKNGFVVKSEHFDLRPSDYYLMTYQGEV